VHLTRKTGAAFRRFRAHIHMSGQREGVTNLNRWSGCARRHGLSQVRLYTNEAMTENLAYYPRRGYAETHRAEQGGFRRVFFSKVITA